MVLWIMRKNFYYHFRSGLLTPSALRRMRKTATIFLFVIAIAALPVRAQIASERAVSGAPMRSLTKRQSSSLGLEKGMNEFGVWGGGSFDSPTVIGTTEDARFASVGLRYGRILATGKGAAAEYIIDAVPAAVASVPQFVLFPTGSGPSNFRVERIRASIYGVGLSPVGFKFNFRGKRRLQPFASTSGGFLYFRKPIPVPEAARFNYTFDFGGGLQLFTHARRAIMLGYKFQHISNGGRSQANPGLDANVFYIGFSRFK